MLTNQKKHKFIVVEGIDGVGKSTIAQSLAQQLGAYYYKTPSKKFSSLKIIEQNNVFPIRTYFDQDYFRSPATRFLFYALSLVEATTEINHLLETNHVVCDRFFASTLAYHAITMPELLEVDFSWLPILIPDYQFLLTIHDRHTHQERLRGRSQTTDNNIENDLTLLSAVQDNFSLMNLTPIDTTQLEIPEVLEQISGRLRNAIQQ